MARTPILPFNDNDTVMKKIGKSYLDACVESAAVWTGFFAVIFVIGVVVDRKNHNAQPDTPETQE